MLGVPVGFEVRIDLTVDDEHARCAVGDPCLDLIEIVQAANSGGTRAMAACNRREIALWELHDVDRLALPAEVVHFGRIGSIVIDQDAKPKL